MGSDCHSNSPLRLTGHQDWIRALAANSNDSRILSGGLGSILGVWDLPTGTNLAMVPFPLQDALEIEAIMDLSFISETCFLGLQRCGYIMVGDLRVPGLFQHRKKMHSGRGSFITLSEFPYRFVTSARADGAKLWDLRSFPGDPEVMDCVQHYNKHTSRHVPLGHDFLRYEKFFVTGSDDGQAHIYDTLTGQLVHQLKLSSERAQHCCAEASDSLSFFASFFNARYFGLVDVEGELISHLPKTTGEIKDEYNKLAWDEAISQYSDQVLKIVRSNPGRLPMTYDEWLDIVRTNQDVTSQQLAEHIRAAYHDALKASTPSLVRDMNRLYQEKEREKTRQTQQPARNSGRRGSLAPRVKHELTLLRVGRC